MSHVILLSLISVLAFCSSVVAAPAPTILAPPITIPITIKFTCDNKAGLAITLEPSWSLPACSNETYHTKFLKNGDTWTFNSKFAGCVYSVAGALNICDKVVTGAIINIHGNQGRCKCDVQ